MSTQLFVEQHRSGLRETLHPVHAVLHDGEKVRWQVGEDLSCFWRSGCKALQLTTSLLQLPPETLTWLKDEDLAIGGSSHSGEPDHVTRVRRLLKHFGLKPKELRCGGHAPMHAESARKLVRRGEKFTAIHNNCSGKHTFMLAAAAAKGWDRDYRPPEHPLQVENLRRLTEWSGHAPGMATDGCGVPTFHQPLSAMARTFQRLSAEMGDPGSLPGRIGRAMSQFPELTSGRGRLDRWVVRTAKEPLAVKVGAEGLFCIALPERKEGLVVKVGSGNSDAIGVAVATVMEHLYPGILGGEMPPEATLKNVVGNVVGERRGLWT